MQRIGKERVYSPHDLIAYLEGDFASWMDRLYFESRAAGAARGTGSGATPGSPKPEEDDEEMELIKKRGMEHEALYLATLAEQHPDLVIISSSSAAFDDTVAAMGADRRNGDDGILVRVEVGRHAKHRGLEGRAEVDRDDAIQRSIVGQKLELRQAALEEESQIGLRLAIALGQILREELKPGRVLQVHGDRRCAFATEGPFARPAVPLVASDDFPFPAPQAALVLGRLAPPEVLLQKMRDIVAYGHVGFLRSTRVSGSPKGRPI